MHEQSETVQDPLTMLWKNIFGGATPQAGQTLPPRFPFEAKNYPGVQAAVQAAKQRSQMSGGVGASLSDLLNFHPGEAPSLLPPDALQRLMGQP